MLYNAHPRAGLLPAAAFALFDDLINNRARLFYRRREYPIVRATAALSLLNLFETTGDPGYLDSAARHLRWLIAHSSPGYSGLCWGLGFINPVTKEIVYGSDVPYTTMTPYPLEALVRYSELARDSKFDEAIVSVRRFFDQDVAVMEEDDTALAASYGPFRDRTVINASSYTMYSYALLLNYAPEDQRGAIRQKIRKLYAFVRRHQREDGSWLYSTDESSFIDCFHSCIVLKNLTKTSRRIALEDASRVVQTGYGYLKQSLLDSSSMLFRRFSLANKKGLVKFDLYDNAEALNLALLLEDYPFAERLADSIRNHFLIGRDIYSQIDFLGIRRGKNFLRWAAMPFLQAISQMA